MPSPLTADDLYLFNQGTHYKLHDKLGAHVAADNTSTHFAVWAPSAASVSVIGDWNGWNPDSHPMTPRDQSGIWECEIPSIGQGERYKYAITGPDGVTHNKADPFATRAEHPPETASVVWRSRHHWHDDAWMKSRAQKIARDAPISIYEVHLGSWRRDHGEVLGYRALGKQLGEHCRNLGFTHVEVMPLMEHPFYGSWGYQVTGYFAATTRYGAPDDLMAMIDALHQQGIGVILDWVPAHFPTDEHGLGLFDGTHLFEHADPKRGFHPDWTSYIFNYARHEVRAFLISSAMAWLDRFHVDGLRVDGVASMLYRDYSRKPGEWVPNEDGSNHDRDAIAFLQQLNHAIYTAHPDVQTIAEESTAWPGVTRPPDASGALGFGYKWDLGWMHDTLAHLHREPIHRKFHHEELTFRAMYAATENYVMPLSHDEVVHGKGALIDKIPHDPWQKYASLRLLYAYQWTLPGKKLLFMGGELGVWKEWNHDTELDWALGAHPAHAGIARLVGDLNRTYREYRALHAGDCERWGFRWLVADDRDGGVIAYARFAEGSPPCVIACNFTPVVREGYRIGAPLPGFWKEIVNTDAEVYGGSGIGNRGGMTAEAVRAGGHDQSLVVTVPPLGAVVFVHA